jgi:hypothetical protein
MLENHRRGSETAVPLAWLAKLIAFSSATPNFHLKARRHGQTDFGKRLG